MTHRQLLARAATPLLVTTLLFLCISPASAQTSWGYCPEGTRAAYIELHGDLVGSYYPCQLPLLPGVVTLTLEAYAIPFQKIRFSLPDPPPGIFVVGESWNGTTTGDRVNGIEIDMGGCVGPGHVGIGSLTIYMDPNATIACTYWNTLQPEVMDCLGVWHPAEAVPHEVGSGDCYDCCWQCCYSSLPPYDLYPPDGATNVPLNVVLSWNGTENIEFPPDDYYSSGCYVLMGTSPACDNEQEYTVVCASQSFAPDFLQPYTTYYWRPMYRLRPEGSCAPLGIAPLHSFTTGDVIAAEPHSWGYVKSLYR